ncbi:hypothetical protein DFH09DRAFT_1074074 [Mycena vulgaris]|nr:hypothetical protein DFH09DRAFT_1074074 [Mycena vulgaris]
MCQMVGCRLQDVTSCGRVNRHRRLFALASCLHIIEGIAMDVQGVIILDGQPGTKEQVLEEENRRKYLRSYLLVNPPFSPEMKHDTRKNAVVRYLGEAPHLAGMEQRAIDLFQLMKLQDKTKPGWRDAICSMCLKEKEMNIVLTCGCHGAFHLVDVHAAVHTIMALGQGAHQICELSNLQEGVQAGEHLGKEEGPASYESIESHSAHRMKHVEMYISGQWVLGAGGEGEVEAKAKGNAAEQLHSQDIFEGLPWDSTTPGKGSKQEHLWEVLERPCWVDKACGVDLHPDLFVHFGVGGWSFPAVRHQLLSNHGGTETHLEKVLPAEYGVGIQPKLVRHWKVELSNNSCHVMNGT